MRYNRPMSEESKIDEEREREIEQMIDRTFTPENADTLRAMVREYRDDPITIDLHVVQLAAAQLSGDATRRPLTPEEQEALKEAYRPYGGWPSVAYTYQKLSAREVLRLFEERRKVDRKLELKAFCGEIGANYNSIKAAKWRFAKEKRKRKKKQVNS